jgi:hypothetical protein
MAARRDVVVTRPADSSSVLTLTVRLSLIYKIRCALGVALLRFAARLLRYQVRVEVRERE